MRRFEGWAWLVCDACELEGVCLHESNGGDAMITRLSRMYRGHGWLVEGHVFCTGCRSEVTTATVWPSAPFSGTGRQE